MKQHEQACSFCGRQGCVSKGLCATCYQRQRRYGTPLYYRDRKPKPTNADRIRSMSDEELAKLWWERVDCGECPVHRNCRMTGQDCMKLALDWLKQEATDGAP